MKAVVFEKYGSPEVLHLTEIEKPVPSQGQLLIKVKAVSLNAYDWRHLRADPFLMRVAGMGLFRPTKKIRVLGADIAGIVESTGPGVTSLKPGDEVYGEGSYGGLAEFACVKENRFALKPESLSFEEAAAVPMAALTALQGLRDKGKIKAGSKVLINGASGGVGSFAVQIAAAFGADVTAVCSTSKMDFVKSLGAACVVDYTRDDITLGNEKFDLILDTAAFRSVGKYRKILKPGAAYVLAGGSVWRILQISLMKGKRSANMKLMVADINRPDLEFLSGMIREGKLKPMIDKVFPLGKTAEAMTYLESGKVLGKVVVII
jgi:NADPH:quinone reductase-like Zn-dependent oxidoreductase